VAAHDNSPLGHSAGAAAALAGIRVLISDINAAAGGTTTVRVTSPSYNPTSVRADTVVFGGSARLVTDVRGSRGSQHTEATVDGPVTVALVDGVWRVRDFNYNGRSMRLVAENASQVVEGVHLTVGYVLSYAGATNAVVGLAVDSGHVDIALTDARLVAGGSQGPATGSGFAAGPPRGYIGFARTDAIPTELDASFRRSDGATLTFAIPLRGTAG
jgi:hypothetical protein